MIVMDYDKLYPIALSLIPKIGSISGRNLVGYAGSLEQVFQSGEKSLQSIPGIGQILARRIAAGEFLGRAEKELRLISKHGIDALFYLDDRYPQRLAACSDAPIVLYVKGSPDLNMTKCISIVGTRNATEYGRTVIDELIEELASRSYSIMIVSGLAYGIDVHAHRASLRNGLPTVGVLAHGLDMLYPSLHAKTAREMVNHQGGLVTDFMCETILDRKNFVKRNRIIAGLSDATIVVESAIKGGGLVTADIAMSYNRDVFAFPGKVGDEYSAGCNFLIKSNRAGLIEGIKDLEYGLNWTPGKSKPDAVQPRLFDDLTPEERMVVDILEKEDGCPIDMLCIKTGLAMSKVSPMLLTLEFAGVVKGLPGKVFRLT